MRLRNLPYEDVFLVNVTDESMASSRRSHNVGKALHRLRRENGWTLSTVSGKTGVAVSTLSKIENNQTSPNYDVLVRLCEGLELNLAEFFQGGAFRRSLMDRGR